MTCPKCAGRLWQTNTEEVQVFGGKPVTVRRRVCRGCRMIVKTREQIVSIFHPPTKSK